MLIDYLLTLGPFAVANNSSIVSYCFAPEKITRYSAVTIIHVTLQLYTDLASKPYNIAQIHLFKHT